MANIDQDYEWKLIVGGEEISTNAHYDIIDPNTTGIVGKAPEATVQQTLQAAAAAKEALPKWKALSMDERCTYIAKQRMHLKSQALNGLIWCKPKREQQCE